MSLIELKILFVIVQNTENAHLKNFFGLFSSNISKDIVLSLVKICMYVLCYNMYVCIGIYTKIYSKIFQYRHMYVCLVRIVLQELYC